MMKILFFILFIIPLCFMKNMFWMVQGLLIMLSFIYILMNNLDNYFMNISYFMGNDVLSYGLILLSIWICMLMMMASGLVYKMNNFINLFMINLLFLLLFLYLSFSSMNLFSFYLFFESSLIPTLFLILGWGYQPERLQAGIYLLFYTLLVSLPMLMGVIYLYSDLGTMNFYLMNNYLLNYELLYFCMILAFLVKLPMFLVHLWLPKAHVEAPVSGSMILAGIMLKLGGYGLLRVLPIIQILGLKLNFIWVSISLVGSVLVSLVCLRQVDLKSLIAYSSVAHMGIVLSGLMTMTYWGISGSYTLMIAHGLCSSGLFCLANISYERLGSRSLFINKGLLNYMPSMSLWWFLLCAGNMAAPPTLNLLGEIVLLNSIVSYSFLTMIFLSLLSFFSAVYTLYLYAYSQHGNFFSGTYSFSSGNFREFLLIFLHWFPLNLLIIKSDFCLFWL
uniref:NADH-ubiquinone oxidoreductase chain 4 n=1 Tax=Liriomyza sativae TaxID=127406 RepID=G0XQJ0_LIRSA|nr:NADH dehydrogenase subunit 4 [Liriomyza sativae]ADO79013.1 NADH dehydrogenase subunit 4 [Liriomyza sativae]AFL93390.1 NADH dehydrogenase subunit 4 [Liriomyza sativae]